MIFLCMGSVYHPRRGRGYYPSQEEFFFLSRNCMKLKNIFNAVVCEKSRAIVPNAYYFKSIILKYKFLYMLGQNSSPQGGIPPFYIRNFLSLVFLEKELIELRN